MSEKRLRVVTPLQYQEGYFELKGMIAFQQDYQLVRRLPDGNYLVVDPTQPGESDGETEQHRREVVWINSFS
jgi:hypothetical protein